MEFKECKSEHIKICHTWVKFSHNSQRTCGWKMNEWMKAWQQGYDLGKKNHNENVGYYTVHRIYDS